MTLKNISSAALSICLILIDCKMKKLICDRHGTGSSNSKYVSLLKLHSLGFEYLTKHNSFDSSLNCCLTIKNKIKIHCHLNF